jgi:hypothetical protein
MANKNQLMKLLLAAGAVFLISNVSGSRSGSGTDTAGKRSFIKDASNHELDSVVDQFTESEVNDVYTLFKDYVPKNITVPLGSLRDRLTAIGIKYNIFT